MGGISRLGSPALHNAGAYRLQIVGAGNLHSWFTMVVLRADCPQRVPDFVCLWYDKGRGRPKTRLDI